MDADRLTEIKEMGRKRDHCSACWTTWNSAILKSVPELVAEVERLAAENTLLKETVDWQEQQGLPAWKRRREVGS
jgi:hypothetical protein